MLQQLEGNLIYPRVVGSSIGLPGIWVLAAVTVGGKASLKKAAVKNSAEFVFMSARMIGIFSSKFNTKRKK